MTATSLKLPDELKQRLARLAADSGQTPHAYMIEALRDAAERAEQRRAFAADADAAEAETLATGRAYALEPAFDHLQARAAGRPARKPRTRAWRASR
jgi:predicted transcriptional regulator